MSRNGSGVYSLPAGNPVVTGTTISSTWANTTLSDIATALTGSVAADGQTAMTGNLQMGTNKITNLGVATTSGDALSYGQAATISALTVSGAFAANGVATFSAGTVSAPSITTSGDTNTGIYFPAADTIAFTEGGVEAMRITSDGNVGIGTSSVTTLGTSITTLEIKGKATFRSGGLKLSSSDDSIIFRLFGADATIKIGSQTATPFLFLTNDTERMRITDAGNVGIGRIPTSQKLEVEGGVRSNSTASGTAFTLSQGGTVAYLETTGTSATPITIYTNGSERMRIDTAGNVGIGVTPSAWGASYRSLDMFGGGSITSPTDTDSINIYANAYNNNTNWLYKATGLASSYRQNNGVHIWETAVSGTAGNTITFTESMRINASGNVGIGTTSPDVKLHVASTVTSSTFTTPIATFAGTSYANGRIYGIGFHYSDVGSAVTPVGLGYVPTADSSDTKGALAFYTRDTVTLGDVPPERMRIDSSGNLLVAKTSSSNTVIGTVITSDGRISTTVGTSETYAILANRQNDDGVLVSLRQADTQEGTISVSGTTVSYNGGHLSRWSQLLDNSKDESLLKGTVLSNLDEMCVWEKDGVVAANEQLNKMKVSDVEGDTNVAGVFVNWTRDEDYNSDDMNIAMTGDMIIRIAQGVTVQRGDLLMSAGDGTAKPQGDDIVRSKTIAKVTSTNITCTYADGSYCVPCVLMAC
jgi:hypothetical protein